LLQLGTFMKEVKLKRIGIKSYDRFYPVFRRALLTDFLHLPLRRKKYFLRKIWSKKNFKKRFKRGKIGIFSVRKDKTIAFIVVSSEIGGISLLRWIWVDKNFRNKGIGKRLVKRGEKWAQTKNCHKLRFITDGRNRGFYLKLGFVIEGIRKKDRYKKDFYLFGKFI